MTAKYQNTHIKQFEGEVFSVKGAIFRSTLFVGRRKLSRRHCFVGLVERERISLDLIIPSSASLLYCLADWHLLTCSYDSPHNIFPTSRNSMPLSSTPWVSRRSHEEDKRRVVRAARRQTMGQPRHINHLPTSGH